MGQRRESSPVTVPILAARRILIATDGSPGALRAAQWAASALGEAVDDIILLAVADRSPAPASTALVLLSGEDDPGLAEPALQDAGRAIVATRAVLGDRPARGAIMHGAPAEGILRGIDWFRPDAVVLGKRGRGRSGRRLLGSVAAAVAARSPVPVFVVPAVFGGDADGPDPATPA
ncbi:MAG: universal stress protein [Actinomycetia bacterium]|nr:universal stress protein [Actinomycetes bacterium]